MRKIEEILNLKPIDAYTNEEIHSDDIQPTIDENTDTIQQIDSAIDIIDAALPLVRGLDASDKEMDDIAELATNTFKDLIELSMNVEPRFSGPILQSASTLLGHAVTAKIAKMDKKLKMVDLQLKKMKLNQTELIDKGSNAIQGSGVVLDRNELLSMILNNNKSANG